MRPHSRGMRCPSFALAVTLEERGRRESRVLSKHPQPRTQTKKRTSVVTTGSPNSPAFPAQWFYGLFCALPGDRALLPPSLADCSPANLTPASGRQDHTALPYARPRSRQQRRSRPSHPAPNVRDDRDTPLLWARDKRKHGADLGCSAMPSPCDRLTRRANFAWRSCAICPSGTGRQSLAWCPADFRSETHDVLKSGIAQLRELPTAG